MNMLLHRHPWLFHILYLHIHIFKKNITGGAM
jgi:hypothetical protein